MNNNTQNVDRAILREELTGVAVDTTGCDKAGDYARWAKAQGYKHIEVVDWMSSAGDWTFIVSEDGENWELMYQVNAYPRPGFNRQIDPYFEAYGSADEVLEYVLEISEE